MRAVQGTLQGIALKSRFTDVALEYLASMHKQQWEFVPRIITLRVPSEENFMREATDADLRRYHRRNLLIEMRERIPEVIDALQSRPFSVLPDTIQRLGLRDTFYLFGAQVRPDAISHLETIPDMHSCAFREVSIHDIPGTLRLGIAA